MSNKTKIDDILIEMISPKLKEIEERFSKGEGLTNEDINILLLKSQFNHIHHLDQKLNEVTADVSSLKLDFVKLKADVSADVSSLKLDFTELKADVTLEISSLKLDFTELKADVKTEITELKTDIANLKTDLQTSINKNMQWSMGLIVFVVTALKLIDMIWGK